MNLGSECGLKPAPETLKPVLALAPGVTLAAAVGLFAYTLVSFFPLGTVTLAILLGALVGNLLRPGKIFDPGIAFCEKHLLSVAIILMGVNLDFQILRQLGMNSLLMIVMALVVTIFLAILLGRLWKMDSKLVLLLGIGSGICGSSAIAAVEKVVGATKSQVGLSVAVVNSLGTLGIFLLPFVAKSLFDWGPVDSGLLIGNTLQAVGQVVAAGFSLNETTGQTATLVKMARILMLTPVVMVLSGVFARGKAAARFSIPPFVVGFVMMTLVPTFDLLPAGIIEILSRISHWVLVVSMSAIGLRISFANILSDGRSALLLGSVVFLGQILFSMGWVLLF